MTWPELIVTCHLHLIPLKMPVKKKGVGGVGVEKKKYMRENIMLYKNKILGSFTASFS